MLKLTWKSWLGVWLAFGIATAGLSLLLEAQGAGAVGRWVVFVGAFLSSGWLVFGLVKWREVPWVKRVNAFVLATVGFGLAFFLFRASEWETGWRTSVYLYLAVLAFLLGINLLRLILRPGFAVFGVARTMLEEALRMGIALIFIVGLLVMLVLLPLILGSEDRVTYMVQRFLTYSTGAVWLLLGLMTVLLAARSVSLELSSRQAQMTLTKPLRRHEYLVGKWLGIALLNAVLVTVAGVAIYGFTMAIARNPALNDLDRYAVDREILTARVALTPDPQDITWNQMIANVLQEKQARDPEKFGAVGDPVGALPDDVKQEIIAEAVSGFYTVDGGSSKVFVFTGLSQAAKDAERAIAKGTRLLQDEAGLSEIQAGQYVNYVVGRPNELTQESIDKVSMELFDQLKRILEREVIQLVLMPDTKPEPENKLVEITMRVNNQPWPRLPTPGTPPIPRKLVIEGINEVAIPASLISPDGRLEVTIGVPKQRRDGVEQKYLQFNPKDAQIELFYRVGSFESNMAKAMLIIWLKLGFFAMLGLAVGSMLSFPVAAMFGLVVYFAVFLGGYIDQSLSDYAGVAKSDGTWEVVTGTASRFISQVTAGEIYDAFRLVLRLIGESFMLLVPSFSQFSTGDSLSNGEVITGGLVGQALLRIGLLWTGAVGLIGLYLFSRREIARVTV